MAPRESSHLLSNEHDDEPRSSMSILASQLSFGESSGKPSKKSTLAVLLCFLLGAASIVLIVSSRKNSLRKPVGPYKLVECQQGQDFFKYYDFLDGPDSLGSAGYVTYIGKKRAMKLGIANVTTELSVDPYASDKEKIQEDFVFLKSNPTDEGPRDSVRLEGKRRYDRGLFILDVRHMPVGCGVWPAFWLTDEANWPDNGEIDIVEGINMQNVAKTALHTSESCSMYAHVPEYSKTGTWDHSTCLYDTFTGEPDCDTKVPADNCWNLAPHQWGNQGCVGVNSDNTTIGAPLNAKGGGVYALDWDPPNGHIKSWVFSPHKSVPDNLQDAIRTASEKNPKDRVMPEPESWGLPYANFAIGDGTGCSSDHFKNNRLIFNLAFCGSVSGNRFFTDCPLQASKFSTDDDDSSNPIDTCNAYIKSNPKEMDEAYWKVKGVYVYEREWGREPKESDQDNTE